MTPGTLQRTTFEEDRGSNTGTIVNCKTFDVENDSHNLNKKTINLNIELHALVAYPDMPQNMSFARVPDGNNVWAVQTPTPNASNLAPNAAEQLASNGIRVYPIVATSHVYVEGASMHTIQIFDLQGKIVHSQQATESTVRIDLQNLRSGLYILRVNGQTFKLIK